MFVWGYQSLAILGQEPVHEEVAVERVEITLHASDRFGEPILGLSPPDIQLLVDAHKVPIESLEWVQASADSEGEGDRTLPAETTAAPEKASGRLIVLLFQWEIAGLKSEGFLRMQRKALDLVDSLDDKDKVAVLSVGSRLWLRQNFTADHNKIRAAIKNVLRQEEAEKTEDDPLSMKLSIASEKGATSVEKALLAIGLALRPLPGAKAILFFGWGAGRWDPLGRTGNYAMGRVSYSRDFAIAQEALTEAQAPVFSLDISAGSHGLEESLEKLSYETGGLYVPTYDFPDLAMGKVMRTIGSHYVLVFRKPQGLRGRHSISIGVSRPNAVLLYRRFYEDHN